MKAVGSWPMLCSLISVVVFSVCTVVGTTEEDVLCIHEWLIMSSKDGRSAGRRDRHHLISCWHSGGGGERTNKSGALNCLWNIRQVVKDHIHALQCVFTCRNSPPKEDLPSCDLLIVFEWDVTTHHVIEQDTQGPNCGRATVIAMIFDPLWRAVHSCACQGERKKKKNTPLETVNPFITHTQSQERNREAVVQPPLTDNQILFWLTQNESTAYKVKW